ncbi:MAG TPA: lamin tail domain-containing protein, partial [Methylomirabilota bacterium]|nr:lamin tail domain-containing protein [Methylomirabilota bacterium]
ANEIDRAIVPESARWSVNGYTRDTWLAAQSAVRSWFPQRGAILVNQLRAAGLFPALNAPTFAPFGGLVPPSYSLALTNPNASGSIYFTRDGSDPRLWGGALAGTAQLYTGPLTITNGVFLRARVRDGANWSAIVEAAFYVVQDFAALKVTEIMYNPPVLGTNTSDDLEFLELKNTGTNTLDLSGLQFTDGLTFIFTNNTRLLPGAFFVLARNTSAFAQKYPGVAVNGIYTGRLDNSGERLTLSHVLGTNVFSFSYNNAVPWPITADGYGFSIVRGNINGDPDSSSSWRVSANLGGSPGADDPTTIIAPVVINEILTHTDLPQLDSIELFNPAPTNVNISGWFLSDDAAAPKKFRVPNGTIVSPGGFIVFYETDFNAQPGLPPSFALNSHGESLFLFSGDANTNLTGYSHSFDYGAAANGVSFGRYLISTGDENWPPMSALTLGGNNSAPRVGPLVINEVMYHPALGYEEFVEIHNLSASQVALYDSSYPTNAWKLTGLNYTFSNTVSIPAGGYLLVVPTTPAAFRAKYSVPAAVQIVGPYAGVLQDSGERLRLERPDAPDTNGVPYIVVDEVRYNDKVPWPTGADGDGPSIQRRAPSLYGNEPTNWFASGITPGALNVLNQAPTVALIAPTNGAMFMVPATFSLVATAADFDGIVVRVEFYEGDIKIGEATTAPFTFTWTNVSVGPHTIVAKARDNGLAVGTSSEVTITVTPPPVGSGIGLRGDYFDNPDFTGTRVRRVDPFVGFDWGSGSPDPLIGAEQFSVRWTGQVQPRFSEAYTFYTVTDDGGRLWVNNQLLVDRWIDQGPTEWSGVISLQAGVLYDIRMEYYENGGGAAAQLFWSSPSVIKELIPSAQLYPPIGSNLPPVIALTGPATGAVFVASAPVNITTDAIDPDGTILKVEFFANNIKVGEDTSSPFSFSWTNNTAGSFTLKAIATDDSSLSRTSGTVNVTFVAGFTTNVTIISTGAVWKYLDNGSDQASAWTSISFNDAAWSSGPAELGYGDAGEGWPETTVVNYGPNAGAKFITTYFRRAFTVSDPASFSALNLRVMRDDGVVVYLNGSEIYRNNMAGGAVSYLTLASAAIGGADEYTLLSAPVNPGYLVFGTNVIAVEMHQNGGG